MTHWIQTNGPFSDTRLRIVLSDESKAFEHLRLLIYSKHCMLLQDPKSAKQYMLTFCQGMNLVEEAEKDAFHKVSIKKLALVLARGSPPQVDMYAADAACCTLCLSVRSVLAPDLVMRLVVTGMATSA